MNKTAQALLALLGLFLVLVIPRLTRAQSPGDGDPKTVTPQGESPATPPATAPADQAGSAATTHTETTPHRASQRQTHATKTETTGAAKASSSGGQNLSLPDMEQTMLQNLDTASQLARTMGSAAPASWPRTDSNTDAFSNKKNDLQQAFAGAPDQLSQAAALSQTTKALSELLADLQTNKAAASSPAPVSGGSAGLLGRLPLYLSSAALAVSLLALWRGWFLARREVDKALVEAGLL